MAGRKKLVSQMQARIPVPMKIPISLTPGNGLNPRDRNPIKVVAPQRRLGMIRAE